MKFDLIQALLTIAGKLQARKVAKLRAREAALRAAINAATIGLTETARERQKEAALAGQLKAL